MMHVANHHVSPGKKQWTWGNGDFGQAWDRQLTDEDGPYIELMCGRIPTTSPTSPGSARRREAFSQFFLPYKGVGVIKNATMRAVVGLELERSRTRPYAFTLQPRPLQGSCSEPVSGSFWMNFSTPTHAAAVSSLSLCPPTPTRARCRSRFTTLQAELVATVPRRNEASLPAPAQAIAKPEEIDSNESLYLAGLHLEQYRHATRQPEDYFREALLRDPGDIRCNLALGRTLYRRGQYCAAESLFDAAIERATRHNPNPASGECHYDLGLALVGSE